MGDWTWQQEAVKAGFGTAVAAVTLGLGWFIGQRITAKWGLREKQRELELAAASEFYRLYGEFFAVWKLWSYFKSMPAHAREEARWNLLSRASAVDGGIEALFVKVTSERTLASEVIEELGLLRQGFQRLRECIMHDEALNWHHSDNPQYLKFKQLAAILSGILISDHSDIRPDAAAASATLARITSNEFESKWAMIGSPDR